MERKNIMFFGREDKQKLKIDKFEEHVFSLGIYGDTSFRQARKQRAKHEEAVTFL